MATTVTLKRRSLPPPPRAVPAVLLVVPMVAVKEIQEVFALRPRELASFLDISERAIERWEEGDTFPRKKVREQLARLWAFQRDLRHVFGSADQARDWLQTPNRYLGGTKPISLVRGGELERAEQALETLRSGLLV